MTLTRPMFDILKSFPGIGNFDFLQWHVSNLSFNCNVYPDVENERVKRMIVVKREGQCVHRDPLNSRFDEDDLKPISFALHGRNSWFQAVTLNVALDALDELRVMNVSGTTDCFSSARAFIAAAVLH